MSKIIQAKFKRSRSYLCNLSDRAEDILVTKKNYLPGQHGKTVVRRMSNFALQLQAKQRIRFYYGITEKQLKIIFKKAIHRKGNVAENFIGLLESRLDSVVYRSGFASSIFAAKQLVSHGHVQVNGKKVDISSYFVAPGSQVTLAPKAKEFAVVKESLDGHDESHAHYLTLERANFASTLVRAPQISEVPYNFQARPDLIVEYYSRRIK